jgi:hypothetical protein
MTKKLSPMISCLGTANGRYGYRRVTALLRDAGWMLNRKRVERIWRREGLKVPQKQPKRCRLWLNDGSCIRLRPEYPGHVWAYDFVEGRTHDGRKFRILTIIDEAMRGGKLRAGKGNQSGEFKAKRLVRLRNLHEVRSSGNTRPSIERLFLLRGSRGNCV